MSEPVIRALIIEDNPTDRNILAYLLTKRLKCEVDTADNGLAGLRMLSRRQYSVVFLDMILPAMNGDKVLERIRARNDTATIPVVITSANTEPEWIKTTLKLGVYDYVLKPYNSADAIERLAKTLERLKADIAKLAAEI